MDNGAVERAGAMAGDADETMTPEEKAAAVVAERNHKLLTSSEEKSIGVDAPPGAVKGLSRAVGGVGSGVGSAAQGIGEGVGSAARGAGELGEAVGHVAKRVASVGEDARLRSNTEHQSVYTLDSGMSWGRGGQTETTVTRGEPESNPPGARAAEGIAPADLTQTNPTPEILPGPGGGRFQPDADHCAGTWNMSDIGAYKIGG
jgi:hypothetical protein